jgi:hypothetical protein
MLPLNGHAPCRRNDRTDAAQQDPRTGGGVTESGPAPDAGVGKPPARRHWFITGLGIGQICSWGSLYYSFPLIAEAMGGDLAWSKPELFGAASLGLLVAALAAYPVGAAIDRGHGRVVMAGGATLAGILLLAWSQVERLAVFYALMAALGLMQAATLYEPAFAVVARRTGAAMRAPESPR